MLVGLEVMVKKDFINYGIWEKCTQLFNPLPQLNNTCPQYAYKNRFSWFYYPKYKQCSNLNHCDHDKMKSCQIDCLHATLTIFDVLVW